MVPGIDPLPPSPAQLPLLLAVRKPLESLPGVSVRSPRRARALEHAAAMWGPGDHKTSLLLGWPGGGEPGRRAALLAGETSLRQAAELPKPPTAANTYVLPVKGFGWLTGLPKPRSSHPYSGAMLSTGIINQSLLTFPGIMGNIAQCAA